MLAGQSVTVGNIGLSEVVSGVVLPAGSVSIRASAGSIVDADGLVSGANDNDQDITAGSLRLVAESGVGESVNHLESTVGVVSARSGSGGIYLLEGDGLTVGDVGVTVNRVSSDATSSTGNSSDAIQSDVRTSGGGVVMLEVARGDLLLEGGIDAGTGSVRLLIDGKVLDGANVVPKPDISATSLKIEAAQAIGEASNPVEIDVRTLQLRVGDGGVFVDAFNGTAVVADESGLGISSTGDVEISVKKGDLVLNGTVALSGDAQLKLDAEVGRVSQGAGRVITESGDINIFGKLGAAVARVASVSGEIQVFSSEGGFSVPSEVDFVDYGDRSVQVRGVSLDIGANLRGTGSLEFTSPGQTISMLTAGGTTRQTLIVEGPDLIPEATPIVIGDTLAGVGGAPSETSGARGLFLDLTELGRLDDGFKSLIFGSQNPKQQIFLQAPAGQGSSRTALVFNDPLVLVASGTARDSSGGKVAAGEVRIEGGLHGKGLTIFGSGSTTYLSSAEVIQEGNVWIKDKLVIDGSTSIVVTDPIGRIELLGSVIVRSGATLTLSASELVFAGDPDVFGDSIQLEAGATLVLGTQKLTIAEDLVLEGGKGTLRLQGVTSNGAISDFTLDRQSLEILARQTVDGTLTMIEVGVSARETTINSPVLWSEGADSVVLQGSVVGLGTNGSGITWSIGSPSEFIASSGNLELRVNLQAENGAAVSFEVPAGRFIMQADTAVRSAGGLVSINASQGISITAIDTSWGVASEGLSGGVALDASAGTVSLATPGKGGIRTESFSMYGFGPKIVGLSDASSLRVETRNVQVSAPSGIVFESVNASGDLSYRLLSRGAVHEQFRSVGTPEFLQTLPRNMVAGHPEQSLAATVAGAAHRSSFGFSGQIQSLMQPWNSDHEPSPGDKTKAYLKRLAAEISSGVSFVRQVTQASSFDSSVEQDDLLSDLAYGFSKEETASFVLGQPGLQPTSTGSASADGWLFDYDASVSLR